jgi:ribosomal protein L7Ae-like RNA K-turn-binding protein
MKVYVAAPGQHQWPNVPDDVQERILALLDEQLNEEKLQVSFKRPRKRTKPASVHPIKQHLAIGLRCVMRSLKKNQCSLVLVCTSLSPIILTKPILLLSQLQSIPSIRLKNLATFLTKLFGIPHCAVLGFKRSGHDNEQLKSLLESLDQIIHGCESEPSASVKFAPGKLLAPYQNPKRLSTGVKKKPKKKLNKK